MPFIPDGERIRPLVARDGLPRVVADDAGGRHVLFLNKDDIVQSIEAEAWEGKLPADPTPAESAAAVAARATEEEARKQTRRAARQRVRDLKGQKPAQWGVPEMRALLALLLTERGWLDGDILRDVGEGP